jgi:hypothetical protein
MLGDENIFYVAEASFDKNPGVINSSQNSL